MAKIAKETFWNKERERRGWSLKYIAKKTGIPQSTLGSWFAGIKAPRNDHHIEQLCNLFEIPFDKGYNEFYHAEKKWDSSKRTMHYYNTFWNDLREKNNLSLEEISEMTGVSPATISKNFSGRNLPRNSLIEKYCKLFEIPFEEGKAEFQKAHAQYVAIQNGETIPEEVVEEPTVQFSGADIISVDYTFWPSLFANSKFTTNDVSKFLNVEESKVEKYFTGEIIPNFNQLRMLCGLYGGVEMKTGSTAFNLLHEHFLVESHTSASEPLKVVESIIDVTLKAFYNEASYEEFMELQEFIRNKDVRALKMVYSLVDYDTYTALEACLGK